ncbi:hypothetical protein NDU88_001602 [Pleurodeles waltl]|uniref:Uncharacterized protein n=1 Tax=Pleurodeles waltl TaxID=8319 RepID=A0AAV7Q6L0_PLEWA|nr:hypothetical protein NDU88_001602 [Pleurodeles waltl]
MRSSGPRARRPRGVSRGQTNIIINKQRPHGCLWRGEPGTEPPTACPLPISSGGLEEAELTSESRTQEAQTKSEPKRVEGGPQFSGRRRGLRVGDKGHRLKPEERSARSTPCRRRSDSHRGRGPPGMRAAH